ncbi:MAG: hypothetical protein JWN70_3194 [Planctomycetaceae bacterium]|nr:hypothetical protein [Planctomycetaceae bacterium]
MTANCTETESNGIPDSVESGAACDPAECPGACSANSAETPEQEEEHYIEMLGKLPPEIGTMLMAVGIAGILLPGPVGTPMLIAGALVIWPKTFSPLERSFAKWCPGIHHEGVTQIKRFISDLNRRFPENG